MMLTEASEATSPFLSFTREVWAHLRDNMALALSPEELYSLRSFNDQLDLEEVADIYLPLARLLHLYISANQHLSQVTATFLGRPDSHVPYVIAIAGSVAVGKSTTARLLQTLLARGPTPRRVDLITTDGFLYPNAVLDERGLLRRKGFPESYDVRRLIRFVADVKSGQRQVTAPVYSHLFYDIVAGEEQVIALPDVLIVEGLNVLQSSADYKGEAPRTFVSDFFDFSIYVDAEEEQLERWYVERFLRLRETAFRQPESYFRRYGKLTVDEARAVARGLWREINLTNLRANIFPTRERARLILCKGANHRVELVRLRKM